MKYTTKKTGLPAALILLGLFFIACTKKDSPDMQIDITGQWKLDSIFVKQYKNNQLIRTDTSVPPDYFINFNSNGTYSETIKGEKEDLGTYSYQTGDNKITFTSEGITGDAPIIKLTNSQFNFRISVPNNNPAQTEYDREDAYFFLSR